MSLIISDITGQFICKHIPIYLIILVFCGRCCKFVPSLCIKLSFYEQDWKDGVLVREQVKPTLASSKDNK